MTQDEIIEMAVSNGFYKNDEGTITSPFIEDIDISQLLLGFAKDVAAKEREACIELIKSHGPTLVNGFMLTEAIRARGEA
jgi:hypothetical protein